MQKRVPPTLSILVENQILDFIKMWPHYENSSDCVLLNQLYESLFLCTFNKMVKLEYFTFKLEMHSIETSAKIQKITPGYIG